MLLQAASPAGAEIDDDGMITVTARRIDDLAADVAACAAAPCPTRRDVAVSVAYASALFKEGRYRDAKGVLTAAVSRNKGAAAAEPIAVSQLYNAQAMVAKHYGNADIVRRATHSSFTILRDNLGATALPTLLAEYRVAQWELRLVHLVQAESQFTRVGQAAAAAGYPEIADVCDLYRAQVLSLRKKETEAFDVLDAMAARDTRTVEGLAVRRAALAAAVRLASELQETGRADAYAETLLAMGPADTPLLMSGKPLPKPGRDIVGWRWVDIGFWIRPDGSVDEVEVLRGTERNAWAAPLLRVVESRRYAPTKGTVGHYRVERYTMTADYPDVPGGINLKRVVNPRFEMTPMTAGSAVPS
jgi:tetratricopeptide (TPR) repeat protein